MRFLAALLAVDFGRQYWKRQGRQEATEEMTAQQQRNMVG